MSETLFQIINTLMVVWALTIWPIAVWALWKNPSSLRRSATYLALTPPAIWWLAWM